MTEAEIAPLACGRDAAPVWDRAEAGLPLDAHGRACPHCSAAYAEARRLDAAVHRMAATPVPVPEQTLEAVLGRVLETARTPSTASTRARSCRIEQPGPDPAIDVALTVAARFGLDLVSVTARVRQTVTAAGEQALGLPLRRVDIEVVDLWEA